METDNKRLTCWRLFRLRCALMMMMMRLVVTMTMMIVCLEMFLLLNLLVGLTRILKTWIYFFIMRMMMHSIVRMAVSQP